MNIRNNRLKNSCILIFSYLNEEHKLLLCSRKRLDMSLIYSETELKKNNHQDKHQTC